MKATLFLLSTIATASAASLRGTSGYEVSSFFTGMSSLQANKTTSGYFRRGIAPNIPHGDKDVVVAFNGFGTYQSIISGLSTAGTTNLLTEPCTAPNDRCTTAPAPINNLFIDVGGGNPVTSWASGAPVYSAITNIIAQSKVGTLAYPARPGDVPITGHFPYSSYSEIIFTPKGICLDIESAADYDALSKSIDAIH